MRLFVANVIVYLIIVLWSKIAALGVKVQLRKRYIGKPSDLDRLTECVLVF